MKNSVEYINTLSYWETVTDYDQQVISIFITKNIITDAIQAIPNKAEKIAADFGCGVGNALPHLKDFQKVYAVDASSNMLKQAEARREQNVQFIQGHIENTTLPEPCDLTPALASMFPESIHQFHAMMENIVTNTKDDGIIFLFLPSMESFTFYFQLNVDFMTQNGHTQDEILHSIRSDIIRSQFNPLGYVLTNVGTMQKVWIKEEIMFNLSGYGFASVDVEKFELDWVKQVKNADLSHYPRLWDWFVTIKR